jgi:REP element-mobilizing transposase RayT
MPRKPRIHYPGAVYHVMLRGNGGQSIFFDQADRSKFLLLLQYGLEKYQHRIHAFCLMDNHVHLVLQVADIPLSKIMQNLAFRYTQFTNRKQHKTGHLFQGRFKALVVDADNYLLELVRYIHLNPLRAALVDDPSDYGWSSHRCYLGEVVIPWLATDWVLCQLAGSREPARLRYGQFVLDGYADGYVRDFSRGTFEGRVLGSDQFVDQSLAHAEQVYCRPVTMEAILEAVCDCFEVPLKDLKAPGRYGAESEARAAAAWLVRQSAGLQMKQLATILNRDLSGLSQAARRLDLRMLADAELKCRLERLSERVSMSVSQA